MYTIYKIKATGTKFFYIGIAKCIETRMKKHHWTITALLSGRTPDGCIAIHYIISDRIFNKKYKKVTINDAIKRALRIEILDQSKNRGKAIVMEKSHIANNINNKYCTNIRT